MQHISCVAEIDRHNMDSILPYVCVLVAFVLFTLCGFVYVWM